LKADEAAFEETFQCHFTPAVVVGVADDKAGEKKKEIHSQVAVVDDLSEIGGG